MTSPVADPGSIDVQEGDRAPSLVLDLPAMYGDHHVVEVRRLLLELPGVDRVQASSAFRVVEIEFDPDQTSEDALRARLGESGYLGDLDVPAESGEPTVSRNGDAYFRHSAAYEAAGKTMSFGQELTASARPLWPCPGMDARGA